MREYQYAELYFDGACHRNPGGPMGLGVVLKSAVCKNTYSIFGGKGGSCNIAEWKALIFGLEKALEKGATHLNVYGDSLLIINQITGKYRTRQPHLKPFCTAGEALKKRFDKISFQWVPRQKNVEADNLSQLGKFSGSLGGKPQRRAGKGTTGDHASVRVG